MKRVSVWRSKLLKISAITSWASRRRVCDRLDMNSVRSVCSTRSSTSFCTASIFSMRLTTSSDEVLRQDREHARGMLGPQLGQHHRDGLRVFVLEIVRQHLFLDVGELLPHVAAGRAADLVHDAADALRRQVLLQQPLGGVVVAEQRAGGRQPADEFQQQRLDQLRVRRCRASTSRSKAGAGRRRRAGSRSWRRAARRARASARRRAPARSAAWSASARRAGARQAWRRGFRSRSSGLVLLRRP